MVTQPNLRLLGVFAHPDDEVFCVGGTFAKYVAAGAEAMVVSFTQGEAGQIRDANIATRRTLGATRERELYQSCQQLGIQHVQCLNNGDGKLMSLPHEELVRQVTQVIRRFRPDVVFTFDETGGYGHPDHIAICRATTTAFSMAGNASAWADQLAEGLALHPPKRLYHSNFPRNDRLLLRFLVQWLTSLDTRFRGTDEFLHGLMLLADESSMLGYAADHIKVEWYPSGFYIIEQGEPATSLYLILSGSVSVVIEDDQGHSNQVVTLGAGSFIGEQGVAYGKPRNAHVIAATNVTCLVLSPGAPTSFAGRGEQTQHAIAEKQSALTQIGHVTTCIDVGSFVDHKMLAMAAHRSQYPVTPDMFPRNLVKEMLGREYFTLVAPPLLMQTELLPD